MVDTVKLIKICNSVRTTFSASFESVRIRRQETVWCLFGIFREVFHDLSLYDSFSKLCVQNGQCFRKRLK